MSMHKTTRMYTLEDVMQFHNSKHFIENKKRKLNINYHAKPKTKTKTIVTIMRIFRSFKNARTLPQVSSRVVSALGKGD